MGKRTIIGTVFVFGKRGVIELHNVLYVPKLTFNLLSVTKIRNLSYSVLFTDDTNGHIICKAIDNSNTNVYMVGMELASGPYEVTLQVKNPADRCLTSSSTKNGKTCIWH